MAKYKALGMLKDGGWIKDLHSGVKVPYMSARERKGYKVSVNGQHLWLQFAPMHTSDVSNDVYLFAMDVDGNIYCAPENEVAHHSAFMAGNPVAAAGMISVHNGLISKVYDKSGHYQPPLEYTEQFIRELRERGITVTDAMKDIQGRKKSDLQKAYKKRGIAGSERIYVNHTVKTKFY